MAFAYSRHVNAASSVFNHVRGNQTNITNNTERSTGLDYLRNASTPGAVYNSREGCAPCYPGTRELILGKISAWVSNPNDCFVCWIRGQVGTGKTAIAQSISELCAFQGRLAATFFFSHQDVDRSNGTKVVSTIAYQLTSSIPPSKDPICNAVEDDPTVFTKLIPEQFQKLVVHPLTQVCRYSLPRQIVVIDALDECDEKSAREIVRLIFDTVKHSNIPLQFLLTSRPEAFVEHHFNHSVLSISLRDFEVQDDIRMFLSRRFRDVYEDRRAVMCDVLQPWPSNKQMDLLVKKSKDLFIFASSVTKFIDDSYNSPDDQLEKILNDERSSSSAYSQIDQLYHRTLAQGGDHNSIRLILGAIIFLQKPLPCSGLALLLRDQISAGKLRTILQRLRSVVLIPDDEHEPVTTFHESFRDFLRDEMRSGKEYFLDPAVDGASLTNSCLDLLNDSAELKLPNDVDSLVKSMVLRYAHNHCLAVVKNQDDVGCISRFFQFAVCNATALVLGNLVGYTSRNVLGNVAGTVACLGTVVQILSILGLVLGCILAAHTSHRGHDIDTQTMAGAFVGVCYGLVGGVSCMPRNVVLLEEDDMVLRIVGFGTIFDLVILILWMCSRWERLLSRVPAMGAAMMGSAVGRAVGVITASSVIDAIPNSFFFGVAVLVTSGTLCWNFRVGAFGNRFHYYPIPSFDRHHCRWIKARYNYALKWRKLSRSFSIAAPLLYPLLVVQFYSRTLDIFVTHDERRCDWCRY